MRIATAALAATLTCAYAAPPAITAFSPAGARTGATTAVTASGALDSWPPSVWVSDPAVTVSPDKDTKGKLAVTVPQGHAADHVLVRFHNADGASAPHILAISPHPPVAEAEPNDALSKPQRLDPAAFPVVVDGKLGKNGDVDLFAVPLQAGQPLAATVVSYRLGAPLDPLLHVRGPAGQRLAFNHDASGATLDPRLHFTAPETATYTLQLSAFAHPPQANVRFAGGATAVYRLHLELAPPPAPPPPAEPATLTFPAAFDGRIDTPRQADTFAFETTKGTHHRFTVNAQTLGYPTDPVLRLLDADGKALKTADDIDAKTNLDVALDWVAPADGTYTAEVTDRYGAASPAHAYRFAATTPPPSVLATTAEHAFTLTPGKPLEIKLALARRHGHTGDVTVTAADLPPGLAAEPVTFDDKGAATLTITSKPDAPPHSAPLFLTANGTPVVRTVKPTNTDLGHLQTIAKAPLWLTVLPAD